MNNFQNQNQNQNPNPNDASGASTAPLSPRQPQNQVNSPPHLQKNNNNGYWTR